MVRPVPRWNQRTLKELIPPAFNSPGLRVDRDHETRGTPGFHHRRPRPLEVDAFPLNVWSEGHHGTAS